MTVVARGTFLSLSMVLTALLGCGGGGADPKAPPTYPVKGKVVFSKGQGFPGGRINFRNLTKPDFPTNGLLEANGTISEVETLVGKNKVPGAQEGEHDVAIFPEGDDQAKIMPIFLKKRVHIKAGDNDVTIVVD